MSYGRERKKSANYVITLKICDNLKNDETIDICKEFGDFQLGTGSTCCHFLSSINDINASLSLVPLYCLKSPLSTLKKKTKNNQCNTTNELIGNIGCGLTGKWWAERLP